MAAKTTTQSGNWSAGSTWVGGIAPIDGDSATIAAGHTVTFDVDQSLWALGLASLTITGTLQLATSGGPYYLKMGGNISGAGSFLLGAEGSPIPLATKFTVDMMSAARKFDMTGGLTVKAYPAQPANKYIRLSQAENAGATVLHVDTDVTGDIWAAGDTIVVCNIAGAKDAETLTIAAGGIAAGTITVTAGLAAGKASGAYVVLQQRNLMLRNGSGSGYFDGTGGGYANRLVMGFDARSNTNCLKSVSGATVTGPITGCSAAAANWSPGLIANAPITNCAGNGIEYSTGAVLGSLIAACTTGVTLVPGLTGTGVVAGCTTGINICDGMIFSMLITGNGTGIGAGDLEFFSTLFQANTIDVSQSTAAGNMIMASYDHAGVAGDFRSWAGGGFCATDLATLAPGFDRSIKMTMTSTSFYSRAEERIMARAGIPLCICGAIKQSAAGWAYRPRVQIIDPANDPLVISGAQPLAEYVVPDDTNWHEFSLAYQTTRDMPVIVRFLGKNGSGNAWAYWTRQAIAYPVMI